MFYGVADADDPAQDGCTIKLELRCLVAATTGVTSRGQGTETIMGANRCQPHSVFVSYELREVPHPAITDMSLTAAPWASRRRGTCGECRAPWPGSRLKANILQGRRGDPQYERLLARLATAKGG